MQTALKIFKSYEQNRHGLEIWSNDIMVCELQGPEEPLRLWLEDDHYSILTLKEVKIEQCCDQCGRKFKNHHTCNTNMIVYRQIKNVKRCVINDLKRDKFNFECANEEVVVVYYDIETHTRAEVDGTKIHTPYILGFVDSKNNQFQYFTGADCMEKFIDHLFTFENTKVYINAFNGARFDQYEFVKTLNKRPDCELNKLVMNNGAILKATVRNIECFDISKHITGSLRQNLIELGCSTQKGEFDYSLGDDWEKMSLEGQQSCIKYLEGDVMGLKELSERLNKSCFENFKVNLYKYMSTSQLTYAVWVNHTYKENKFSIYLQNGEQESFFRESIFGGRTYKYKHSFTSSQRDAFLIGEISFEDVDDYLIDADVNSLYPAAMKEEFPIGEPIKVEVEEFNNFIRLNGKCPYMGIFRVEYVTNKNLIDSVLPRREKGRLIWDLHDSNGVYNSVDIDNALKLGYTIKIIEGYYWEKTSKVFCNYINFLYEFKKQAAKGTAQFTLAKLMMNGLYGKTIQRPNLDENVKIRLHEEFIKYHIKYGGVAMKSFSGGSYYLTYQDADNLEKKITKPVYLGSFILGYSRRIMLEYLQKTNPYFNSTDLEQQLKHSPYYTDTDSIQIHQRNIRAITLNKEIGGISDDLGHNCKILHGGWIAPKLYFLEYVEKKGDSVEIKYHLRGKGVPKSQLTVEIFKEMMLGNSIQIEMNRNFKRIHVNRNSNQTNVENFSILKLDSIIKEINTSPWQGRNFYDNGSVPLNHSSIQ